MGDEEEHSIPDDMVDPIDEDKEEHHPMDEDEKEPLPEDMVDPIVDGDMLTPISEEVEEDEEEEKGDRIATLAKLNYTFDSVTNFLINGAAKDSDRLESIISTMVDIAPIFEEMKDNMKKEGASDEAWKSFEMTLDRFSRLLEAMQAKVLESDALEITAEKDQVQQTSIDSSELKELAQILSDVNEVFVAEGNVEGLQEEIDYVKAELSGMEPTETTLMIGEVANTLTNKIGKSVGNDAVEEEKDIEDELSVVEHGDVEGLAKTMSELGFPGAKIEQIKSIPDNEGEAYEVNDEEKEEIMKDETEY